jgi:outer membrane receptor protein involved in Fe transport
MRALLVMTAVLWSAISAPSSAQGSAQARCDTVATRVDTVATPGVRWSAPLDRTISVALAGLTLRNALGAVERAGNVKLSYSSELLPLDRAACAAAASGSVGDVLTALLAGTQLTPVSAGRDQIALTPWRNLAQGTSAPNSATTVAVLDRVVVTGSSTVGPERDLTIALDVIDGRDLERRQISTLAGALDGTVPGTWLWQLAPTSLLSGYGSIRGASSFGLTYPKIYVDGIEAANPLLMSQFAPESIDRIEVIRGPQGSALYGSDAISGVINVITTKGATSVSGRTGVVSRVGFSQSDYSSAPPVAQTHVVTLATAPGLRSANVSAQMARLGEYVPGGYAQQFNLRSSARAVGSRASINATARLFAEQAGIARNPLFQQFGTPPTMARLSSRDALPPGSPLDSVSGQAIDSASPQSVWQYTLGATVVVAGTDRWTHTAVAGIDGYRLANIVNDRGPLPSAADSALRAAEGGADRSTLRASSAVTFGDPGMTGATLTFSGEHAALREQTAMTVGGPGVSPGIAHTSSSPRLVQWQNNLGFTAQVNATFQNVLMFTGGVRLEHNDALEEPRFFTPLPMVGIAMVRDLPNATVKLRTAYGKGIRAPQSITRSLVSGSTMVRNPTALSAEEQSGIEAGIDVVIGRRLSVQVTRFDQSATGLVQRVPLWRDSTVTALGPGQGGAGGPGSSPQFVYQLQNIGEINNGGWELGGTASLGQLKLHGSLSTVASRVIRVAPGYGGDLRPGDRMLGVPARTLGVDASWRAASWTASLRASRANDWIDYARLDLASAVLGGQHSGRDFVGSQLRTYWRDYTGSTHLGGSFSRQLTSAWTALVTAENLLNRQRGEPDDITIVPGRTVTLGLKAVF